MSNAEPSSFGDLLRRYRTAARLTQEELAERAGLSARGVSDLERGVRRMPHPDTARRLADALRLGHSERTELLGAADRAGSPGGSAPLPRLTATSPLPLTVEEVDSWNQLRGAASA
jgi:transcriptional regulator with XRE-family HTH domain